jgi:hypothetical protein
VVVVAVAILLPECQAVAVLVLLLFDMRTLSVLRHQPQVHPQSQ